MKRRPRKITTRVIVFLLLGAIVNVAVAWGLLTLPSRFEWNLYKGEDWVMDFAADADESYMQGQFDTAEIIELECRVTGSRRLGWTLKQMESRPNWDKYSDDHTFFRVDRLMCGLPMRSLNVVHSWDSEEAFEQTRHMALTHQRDALPFRPLWPGFAINTIFYAAILWAVFFAPGSVRRTLRRRRGLCPACAYPVGTSPVCTECGKPVFPKSVEPI